MKKLNTTRDDIITALSTSTSVEFDEEKNKVRRLANKPVPELSLLKNKRKKDDSETPEPKENETIDPDLDVIILRITTEADSEIKWKQVNEKIKEDNKNLKIIYIRFNKNEGHLGVKRDSSLEFKNDFKITETLFKLRYCEPQELVEFWENHGSHFDGCIKKNHALKKKQNEKTLLKNPTRLGDLTYFFLILDI